MPIDKVTICRGCKNITCTCETEGRKTNEKDISQSAELVRRPADSEDVDILGHNGRVLIWSEVV